MSSSYDYRTFASLLGSSPGSQMKNVLPHPESKELSSMPCPGAIAKRQNVKLPLNTHASA